MGQRGLHVSSITAGDHTRHSGVAFLGGRLPEHGMRRRGHGRDYATIRNRSAAAKETEVLTSPTRRMDPMTTVTTKDGVQVFYKDCGPKSAQSIVFHHGWPLSSDDWKNQMLFFGGRIMILV